MKSKALNRNLKLKIYKTIIRPVVTYGCETWNLTCKDELMLGIFERKILRRIFGPVRNNDGSYRILMNHELDNLIKGANITRFVKSRRIAWFGHVMRMEEHRIPKRVLLWKPEGRRLRGKPRKRWIDGVEEDMKIMKIRGWRRLVDDRGEWKKIIEKAKTHPGL